MKDKVIIFFTRVPTIGETKTRLEQYIGKKLCVEIQTAFIKDIYNEIKDLNIDIIVNFSNQGNLEEFKKLFDKDPIFLEQEGEDLGEKMYNAIDYSLKEYENVLLIGSDIPLLNKEDINRAFTILENNQICISPTFDGGYYLIGMKKAYRSLFKLKYSTSHVFEETVDAMDKRGLSYEIGNKQLDIDIKEDLLTLYNLIDKEEGRINTKIILNKILNECELNE